MHQCIHTRPSQPRRSKRHWKVLVNVAGFRPSRIYLHTIFITSVDQREWRIEKINTDYLPVQAEILSLTYGGLSLS